MQANQIPEAMARLSSLFPSTLQPTIPEDTSPPSYWSSAEMTQATRAGLMDHLRAGWKYVDGLLVKGAVKARIPQVIPMGTPGALNYNPRYDAFALRLGATFIDSGPWAGRYKLDNHIVDGYGQFVDQDACPICQGSPFRVRVQNPNPFAKPWEQVFRTCPRCVTREMIEENERHMLGVNATKPGPNSARNGWRQR